MRSMPGGDISRGTGNHPELDHDFSDVPCVLEGVRDYGPFSQGRLRFDITILASTIPISGLGGWGMLEAGWAAGFLLVGLSKESAIATGFGVHILVFMVSAITGLLCWLPLKRQSPSLPA